MTDLMKPILNLNGTSAQSLVDARINARTACRALMQAIAETAPNGRDYIGQPDAYKRDLDIYCARFAKLDGLYNTLEEEAAAIIAAAEGGAA